jgi:hypothetical protein
MKTILITKCMTKSSLYILAVALLAVLTRVGYASSLSASEYQWSIPVNAVLSTETSKPARAWLWIPPSTRHVRAVIVGQHNLLEETVFDNATIRKAAADNDMAIVWTSPAFDSIFRSDQGAGEVFEAMMKALAEVSGYTELATAPIVPIGHSAMAGYPYQFAAWNPGRTLAAISIKGTYPDGRSRGDYNFDNTRLNGVPLLFISGEFEDANGRSSKAADFRRRYPLSPLTVLADSGGGHFDFEDRLALYLALYLRKVSKYRLPPRDTVNSVGSLVPLTPIDPTRSGWLYDRFRRDALPKADPAPLALYAGPKDEALWAFDEELARATHDYALKYRLTKPRSLGYLQNSEPVPATPGRHEGVILKLNPVDDGATFNLSGFVLDPTAEAGAAKPESVSVDVITGPLKKTDPDTFAVQFGRIGFDNGKRSGGIWLWANLDGDEVYKRAVQQAALNIPIRNTSGAPQTLTFDPIPDQPLGVSSLALQAKSSADVPVSYYVLEGPATVENGELKFSALPPRAKTPVKVTVVAYHWGRPTGERLQSAEPVARTFYLLAPGEKSPDAAQQAQAKSNFDTIWAEAAARIAALPVVANASEIPDDLGRAYSFNFAQSLARAPLHRPQRDDLRHHGRVRLHRRHPRQPEPDRHQRHHAGEYRREG